MSAIVINPPGCYMNVSYSIILLVLMLIIFEKFYIEKLKL